MKRCLAVLVMMGLAEAAGAQVRGTTSPVSTGPDFGYIEGVAQSAFGNVTSQSFGGEAGVKVMTGVQVFVDFGRVRDAAPVGLGTSAQTIAGFLSRTQTGVAFQVKQPMTFGVAGLRYVIPVTLPFQPYVLGGGGAARVEKSVRFTVAGNDVTSSISQYGVVLGSDLTGQETKGMFMLGGGVAWPAVQRLMIDFQYRFGRVMTTGEATTVNRAGISIGVRF